MIFFFRKIFGTVREWLGSGIVRNYGANAIWMMAARCTWIVTAFTAGIIVARKLGPDQFGKLNFCIAWVGMFAIILDLGVGGVVQRELIRHPEKQNLLLGNFSLFRGVQTIFMLLTAAGALFFSGQPPEIIKMILILLAGYSMSFAGSVSLYFSATVKNKYEALSQIFSCLVYNSVRICAVVFDWSLTLYACAESIQLIVYHVFLLGYYVSNGNSPGKWEVRIKDVFGLFLPAIPLSLSGIFSTIYSKTDILMLEHFSGFESVGFYTIASRFTLNLALFSSLISGIFSVAVSTARKISEREYRKQLHRYYFMLFWLMVPFFPLFWMLSRYIFVFLYGAEYSGAAAVFSVYVCTLPCTGLLNAFYWHATFENRLKTIAAANGAGAVINVAANWIMIPAMGVTGAAWSSVISMPLGFGLVLISTKYGRFLLKLILKSVLTLPSFRLRKRS